MFFNVPVNFSIKTTSDVGEGTLLSNLYHDSDNRDIRDIDLFFFEVTIIILFNSLHTLSVTFQYEEKDNSLIKLFFRLFQDHFSVVGLLTDYRNNNISTSEISK